VVEDTVSGVSGVDLDQRKAAGPDSSRTSRVFDRSRAFRTNAWLVAEPGGDASGLRDPSFTLPERGSPPRTCPSSRARSAARPARLVVDLRDGQRPHRDDCGRRSIACKVQRQCILGPRRRRLSFRHAVDGPHALCRRTVHDVRSAGLYRAGAVRRQHLRAQLRFEGRHGDTQRVGCAHR
jgi:hypothetical protein